MRKRIPYSNLLLIFAAIILSMLFSLSSLFFPLSNRIDFNDSAIYQYIGHLICEGGVPYVDAFDHKGIYFYFINSLGYLISPKWGMWPLICICMFCNILIIYHIARRFLNKSYSVIITILIASAMSCSTWDGDTPDSFAVLFNLIAFDMISEYFVNSKLSRKKIFIAGITSAVAFWMKLNMITGTLVLCGCLILYFLIKKQISLVNRCLAFFTLGFCIATLPGIIWLGKKGALAAMVEDYFLFNFSYASFNATFSSQLSAFSTFIGYPIGIMTLGCILTFLITLLGKTNEKITTKNNGMICCGSVSYVTCLIHASMTGNSYPQYMMLMYPSIVLILVGCIWNFNNIWKKKKNVSIVIMLAALVVISLNAWNERAYCVYFWSEVPQEQEEVDFISNNTAYGDTIASVSPYNSGLYIATNRESATKYVYVQANHYVNMSEFPEIEKSFWEEYTDLLIDSRPRMIIYDTGFLGNDNEIKTILNRCLNRYFYAGASATKEFYVLPYSEEEEIPEFVSEIEVDTSLMSLDIPEEMIECYKNGEITLDEFLKLFDQEWNKR